MIDLLCADNPVWETTALLPSLPPDVATAPICNLLADAVAVVRDGGGSAHNAAIIASRLGRSVAVVGRAGDDEEGRLATAALQGVRAHIAVSPGRRTKRSFIFKGPDDRGFFRVEVPERAVLPLRTTDVPADLLRDSRLLHLDRVTDTALALARLRDGRPVSLDLHTCPGRPLARERLDALLPLLAVLQLSEAAARDIGSMRGLRDVADVAASLAGIVPWVVVTLGSQGSVAACGPWIHHTPPTPACVVDSTGAGDAHAAALLDGWLDGVSLREAAARAARAGALACGALGARGAVIRPQDLSPTPGAAR